jgi:hypothetical protein
MLQFLILPLGCFHVFFERKFASQFGRVLFLLIPVATAVPFVMAIMITCFLTFLDKVCCDDKLCLNIAGNTEAGSDEQDLALGPSASRQDGAILGPHDDSFWRRLP